MAEMASKYRCYFCSVKCNELDECVNHCVTHHSDKQVTIRTYVLDTVSGLLGYQTKRYPVVPDNLPNDKFVGVIGDKVIVQQRHSENTPSARKKVRVTTPTDKTARRRLDMGLNDHEKRRSNVTNSTDDELEDLDHSTMMFNQMSITSDHDGGVGPMSVDSNIDSDNNVYMEINSESIGSNEDETEENVSQPDEETIQQIVDGLPQVIDQLKQMGQLQTFEKFHKVLKEGVFPTNNIAYLLFLDTVEYYASSSTSQMRYKYPETVKFWKIFYRLFHGKGLRFMSGPRGLGNIVEGREEKGKGLSQNSRINFAIPTIPNLFGKQSDSEPVFPGISTSAIESVVNHAPKLEWKLGIDGKKITRGKGVNMGDIDCWGFEKSPTLKERKALLEEELNKVSELSRQIQAIEDDYEYINNQADLALSGLKDVISVITVKTKELRETSLSLDRSICKFKDLAGTDWRKSKYLPLISSLSMTRYDTEQHIEQGLGIVNKLMFYMATINGAQHNYCKGDTIKIDQQQNYYRLLDNHNVEGSRFIKQRSQSWFELRKQMKVTGSTMNKAVGIDGLKKQQEYFDHVIYGKTDESMTHDAKTTKAMDYGVKHEIDAVGTLVGRILPAYFPELLYCEEGCALINKDNELFYLSSPDGSIRSSVSSEPTFMYETKCKPPVPTTQMTPVYYTIPKYYIMQILGEMKSYDSKQLIFTCWSEQSTVVMKADFSNDLWQDAWAECCKIYDINCPRRPYKRSAESIQIQDKLSIYLEEHTKIICELPSLKVENSNQSDSSTEGNESPFATPLPLDAEKEEEYVKCDTVLSTLFQVNKWLKHTYELNRSVASEILLFMANDLDRQYNPEGNNSHPIAYAMKGSSLPVKNFRLMVDKVIKECESKGMPILVVSTDGQWGRYGTRSFKDGPLTRLQLQKDLWHEIQALSKTELKNWLKELNKVGAEDHLREIRVLKANGDKPQLVVEGMVNESVLPRTSTHILKIMFQNEEKRGKKARKINAETDTNASTLNETDLLESIPTNLEVDADLLTELDKLFADVDMTSEEQAEYINDWPESLEESHAITDAVERLPVSNTGESELDDQSNHNVNAAGSNNTNSTNISRFEVLTDKDYLMMFEELKRSDSKEKWHSMTLDTFKHLFQNKETIDKSFCKTEVKACVRATQGLLKKYGLTATLSRSKYDLVQSIATLTCNSIESSIVSHKKKCQSVKAKRINPKSLRVLCLKQTTQKYSKETLSVLRAECVYNDKLMTWINTSSPVPHGINLDGLDTSVQWFSQPETCKDGKTRFHLVDACHILTCIRTKICTSGIPDAGLSRKAWEKAALSSETTLNIALITDCVDKQSVPYACKVFAKDVENYMVKSNDLKEAEFTKLIREWFEAEDERGLTAVERCKRRLALREWLLRGVRFDAFPPHGMYIKGFPSVTFEALLTHIERKLQLFQYAPGKRYNVRSIGSQEVESFFSTLRDLDPNGHGTMKPDDIPHIMRVAMELDDAKLDPNRGFYMSTTDAAVYPQHCLDGSNGANQEEPEDPVTDSISFRDHFFDTSERCRTKATKKSAVISSPGKPAKRECGVREFHKNRESKLLANTRGGMRDIPISKGSVLDFASNE